MITRHYSLHCVIEGKREVTPGLGRRRIIQLIADLKQKKVLILKEEPNDRRIQKANFSDQAKGLAEYL